MQDTLKMKRAVSEYDKDGNLVYSKTEYYSDDNEIPDIKVTFRTEENTSNEREACNSCTENDQTEEEILDELDKQLNQVLAKLRIMSAVRTAVRCALYAAATYTAAKLAMKLKER